MRLLVNFYQKIETMVEYFRLKISANEMMIGTLKRSVYSRVWFSFIWTKLTIYRILNIHVHVHIKVSFIKYATLREQGGKFSGPDLLGYGLRKTTWVSLQLTSKLPWGAILTQIQCYFSAARTTLSVFWDLQKTRGPQALTVTWVSETLHWLLVRGAHIRISTAPS